MIEGEARPVLSRRRFLTLAGLSAGGLTFGGCGLLSGVGRDSLPCLRHAKRTGDVREYSVVAAPISFEVGGREVHTWGYDGAVPGPEIRAREGDTLRVTIRNRLPRYTTVHWHGLPVPNAMDGVPYVTQRPVAPGEDFVYEFAVPTAGTYLYHSHVGLQLDRGLYGPLVIEPKTEELYYDREYTLMLDDWLDGLAGSPEAALDGLRGGSGGMMGGHMSGMMDGGAAYPLYLVNGRAPQDPGTFKVRRGEHIRLRLINPSAGTIFRFAVAGHRLTVTHADGQPVHPVEVDAVRIGMGERYDLLIEANNPGVWQIAAFPEGQGGLARSLLRYEESGEEAPPPARFRPDELDGRLLGYTDLRDACGRAYAPGGLLDGPDRVHELVLSGGMGGYVWTIDGQRYPDADPLKVSDGEWVTLTLHNLSMVAHPMHLHGHFFQIRNGTGQGPFKDTVIVEPHMGELDFDFVADNPGEWFFHCHNLYHMESGMARVVTYMDQR